jgi:hypothetical protein
MTHTLMSINFTSHNLEHNNSILGGLVFVRSWNGDCHLKHVHASGTSEESTLECVCAAICVASASDAHSYTQAIGAAVVYGQKNVNARAVLLEMV